MARKLQPDKLLFLATFLLIGTSLVMVYSASAVLAMERFQQPYLFLIKQAMWVALGVAILSGIQHIDYRSYRNPPFLWALLGTVCVALVLVLFSAPVNGSRRWFGIGGIGVQPSEFAKLCLIFCVAALIDARRKRGAEMSRTLLPVGLVTGLLALLIFLEPDFGTAAIVVAMAAIMLFGAGLSYSYFAGTALCALPVVFGVLVTSSYRWRRVTGFLDPWADPAGDGFQYIQSFIAVGTGGLLGRGLMEGVQKLFYLPEPHTDFIYAVIGEELGLVGATLILACFCVIVWRGLTIATRATDEFGALVAIGITAMIGLHAFLNISIVLGLLPITGTPLPFVSAGGSSLLVNMVAMGVLLNVSQHTDAG